MISTFFCSLCGAANEQARTSCFACGQPLVTEKGQTGEQGEVLLNNRYQLGERLGSGGFSAVYCARDMRESGRTVAIKQISLQGLNAEEKIEATNTFNREVHMLSALNHPQVPLIYDHLSDQDHWYLVLEYIAGQTLETYLAAREAQRKPLQIEEMLAIASQLCTVLAYLHNRQPPIIYRDLKPSNIMRDSLGKLYLIDFGIARRYTPGQRRDTQALGSPGYAAPEQYGRAQTTPQADIYSLGALLHQFLSGQDPSDHPQGLLPLSPNGQAGNADLEVLVTQMLLPNPGERPGNMRMVAEALDRIQQMVASTSKPIWQPPTPQAYPESGGPQIQFHLLPQAPVKRTRTSSVRPGWTNPPPLDQHPGFTLVGFILGICSLLLGFNPCFGLLPALGGIVLSCYGLGSVSRKKLAVAGLVLSLIGVVIAMSSCALSFFYPGF